MLLRELTKKSLSVFIIRITGVFVLFLFTLFITNFFSPENVGRYDFVRSTVMIIGGIALMGTNQAIIYYSGLLKAKNSMGSIKSIYFKMLKIIAMTSFAFLFLYLFLSVENKTIINSIFNKPDAFNLVFKSFAVLIFFTSTMLNIDTIRAIEKTMISELYRNIFRYTPVFIGAIVLFFMNRQDLIVDVYLAGFFILSMISSTHVLLSFKKEPYAQNNPLSYTTKEILKVSSPMAVSAMAYFVMQSIDVIILAIYEGFDKLAYYSVSVKLATLIALALLSVNIVVAPKIAELYEKKKKKEMQTIIKKSTRIIFIISVITLLFLVLFSEFILGLFGQNYLVAKQALIILIFGQFFNSISGPGAIYLNMTKRQGVLNRILLTGLIINIALNFYLIPNYGISGAAIATLISFVFWNIIIILYIYHKDQVKVFLT